ncbi:TPA: hypothetical protein HA265_05420 [Candidatus Woesearchaeota archaeon]|nr:hypothetical protein [Candidatus Woesearchaeota archaeon]
MNCTKTGLTSIAAVVALLLAVTCVYAEYTYISESDILTASLVNQDPDPAIAGNMVELRIGIENWGSKPAEGYFIELVLDYPFEPISGQKYILSTDRLEGFQTVEDQKIIKFKVMTDREIPEGSYDIDVLLYKEGQREYAAIKKTLSVDVKTRENAEVIYIGQVKLVPGQQTPMEFTINNVGRAPLKDLIFSWENEDDVVLPVGSADTKYIKYLGVGEKTTVSYDVIADTNADPGLYKLTLSLVYDDPVTGVQKEVTNNAGVYVGGGTDFEIAYSESTGSETSFSIANIGSNPASSVSIMIPEQDGWRVSGSNSAIIGNLNKGDYTVASFSLQQEASAPQGTSPPARSREDYAKMTDEERAALREQMQQTSSAKTIKVDVAYTDTLGDRYVLTKDVTMGLDANITRAASGMRGNFAGGGFGQNGRNGSITTALKQIGYYILGAALAVGLIIGLLKYRRYRIMQMSKKYETPKKNETKSKISLRGDK